MKDNTVNQNFFTSTKHPCETQVRPGILVLVNDSDWELLGELEYVVQVRFPYTSQVTPCLDTPNQFQEGDSITFISTLHGG